MTADNRLFFDPTGVVSIGRPSVSPDGRRLAYSANGSIRVLPCDGGRPRRLTQGPYDLQPLWSPADDESFVFLRTNVDRKGQKAQVFMQKRDRSSPVRVTPDFDMTVNHLRFVPTGHALSFISPDPDSQREIDRKKNVVRIYPQDAPVQRVWILPLKSGRPRAISPPDASIWEYDWFPDGRSAMVIFSDGPRYDQHARSFQGRLGILQGGKITPLNANPGGRFKLKLSPDGAYLAFLASNIFAAIAGTPWAMHIASGRTTRLMSTKHAHAENVEWLPDGSGLVLLAAEGVRSNLYTVSLDAPGGIRRIGSSLPSVVHNEFAVSPYAVIGTAEGYREPPELWSVNLRGGRATRLTTANRRLRRITWPLQRVIRWDSANRFSIEGMLTLPPGHRRHRTYPAVIIIHGGPCSRFQQLSGLTQREVLTAQALAAHGYAVLEPNIRGSFGYGDAFLLANMRDWGGGDFRDVMAGADYLVAEGIADPDRLAIYGASYGGFMTNWAVTRTDRFKAAVSLCGSSDHLSKYYLSDICPGFMDAYFGKPSRKQRELLWARSPIAHVRKPKTPILILHGEKDERVPVSQSLEMYRALVQAGAETELVLYPTLRHGLGFPDAFEKALSWLDRHLKEADAADGPQA